MKRTAEKVLSIISLIFTVLGIIGSFFLVGFMKLVNGGEIGDEIEMELFSDPSMTPADVEGVLLFFDFLEGFSWFFVVVLIISLIATIVGMVFMWNDKNAKLAGIMFIVAGLFAFLISPTSIMLYVAAILCFTRKPPLDGENQSFVQENYDDSMRPL